MKPSLDEHEPSDGPVLPEQTADDEVDRSDRPMADDPDDLDRFLRDVPPHHEA